jgi:ABC-2 type transport system ATP-binding protein
MSAALELRGLSRRLCSFDLKDVDLVVPRGTITGLVGANGAGKSTLLRLVLSVLAPDAGTILLFGEDARSHGPRLRARVGFVEEQPLIPTHLRLAALEDFLAPFYPTWDHGEFQRLGAFFEIPERTPFGKMSQGNRMKTALVLALSHRPELLVLDEPTSGLDPLVRRDFLDLLLEVVQDQQRAVLFSTHITSDLDRVADHIAFLKEGRLALAGAKDDILESWRLVKGGEDLLETPPGLGAAGGRRTELGLELLCPASTSHAFEGHVVERPTLEDLVYLHGRPLEPAGLAVHPEEAPCSR